jgi:hypothetical protein
LCPRTPISGGKPIKKRQNGLGASRVAAVLRMGAVSIQRSKTALGAAFRRLARHRGMLVAVTAIARKLAQHVYRLLRHGQAYLDIGEQLYEARYRHRRVTALHNSARELGFNLVPRVPAP